MVVLATAGLAMAGGGVARQGEATPPTPPQIIAESAWQPVVVVPVIRDPLPVTSLAPRIDAAPTPKLIVKEVSDVDTVRPEAAIGRSISGKASWYCRAGRSICTAGYPDVSGVQAYAAAGPRLRAALGDWRGRVVYVDGIRVKLIDWCQCYKGEPHEKLLDLYYDVYALVGGSVKITW